MKRILPLTLILTLASCASMMNGKTQQIVLNSQPQGATCKVSNAASSQNIITPGFVNVERSKSPLQVECRKNNEIGNNQTPPDANFWTLGNVATLGIGYFYDVYDGSSWRYPSPINIILHPTNDNRNSTVITAPVSAVDVQDLQAPNSQPVSVQTNPHMEATPVRSY